MLAANGYKVGMYTSPAVEDIREQYTVTRLIKCSELQEKYLCKDKNPCDEPRASETLPACVKEGAFAEQNNSGIDRNNLKKMCAVSSPDDAVLVSEWISDEDYAQCLAEIYAAQMGRMAEYAQGEHSFELSRVEESETDNKYDAPTPFETETAIAFLYFYKEKCDYVVLETGMGGRDDATNIVTTTVLSVLTSISEDHLGMIGNNMLKCGWNMRKIRMTF
jgi:folylpolyglutamate synthase/dihydropteroate synthase